MKRPQKHFKNQHDVPQTEPIIGRETEMEKSAGGGFLFKVNYLQLLDRFLITGTEGGTYYVSERKLTRDAIKTLIPHINAAQEGVTIVNRIVQISDQGRAANNDYALYALALCAASDSVEVRTAAFNALPKVARIATHLYHFCTYLKGMRTFSSGVKKALQNWMLSKEEMKLAFQFMKYKSRDGWSAKDTVFLSRVNPSRLSAGYRALFRFIVKGDVDEEYAGITNDVSDYIIAAEEWRNVSSRKEITALSRHWKGALTHEMVNNEVKKEAWFWELLMENKALPMMALIRNLRNMTNAGYIKPLSNSGQEIHKIITDGAALKRARIHPIFLFNAFKAYSTTEHANQKVLGGLEEAFYESFRYVEPSGKRIIFSVDVSSSMEYHNAVPMKGVSCAEVAAVMMMVAARVEDNSHITAFSTRLVPFNIRPSATMNQVMQEARRLTFGGTDMIAPLEYAVRNQIDVDGFVVYSDGETWGGRQHNTTYLQKYKQITGHDVKFIHNSFTATLHSPADPKDMSQLDICGMDSATPSIISSFLRGEF